VFNAFNEIREGQMDKLIERLANLAAYNCRQVIDEGHPLSVEAVGGSEKLVCEVHCAEEDRGLVMGRQGQIIEANRTLVRSACRNVKVRTSVAVTHSRQERRPAA